MKDYFWPRDFPRFANRREALREIFLMAWPLLLGLLVSLSFMFIADVPSDYEQWPFRLGVILSVPTVMARERALRAKAAVR